MKLLVAALFVFVASEWIEPPDMSIPARDIALITQADYVEVTGLDAVGHEDDFTIQDAKAIHQFINLLTSVRYVPVPKSIDPHFKCPSRYHVQLFAKGAPVFTLDVVAISVLDIPGDDQFYMESDRHSQVLMAPLCKIR